MIKKIDGSPLPLPEARDPKILKAAQMYETQFLREMVRAMRKTVGESGLVKTNMSEKIFREQLDDEFVDKWVDVRGGIGLSNLIHDQIVERYGSNLGTRNQNFPAKPKGPMDINSRGNIKVKPLKPLGQNQISIGIEDKGGPVFSPWSGKVTESFRTTEGLQVVKLSHDNDVFSIISFSGEGLNDLSGSRIEAGESIGNSNSQRPWIDWHLNIKT